MENETLPNKLRRELEILANTPSNMTMTFWNEFSNDVLLAANFIEGVGQNIESEGMKRLKGELRNFGYSEETLDAICKSSKT